MRHDRTPGNLIKPEELEILTQALPEKGELVFPLPPEVVQVLVQAVEQAQRSGRSPLSRVRFKLLSWWNFSFASLLIFLSSFGVERVEVEAVGPEAPKGPGLRVRMKSNHRVEHDGPFRPAAHP